MSQQDKARDLHRVKSIIDNFDFGYVVRRAVQAGMSPQIAPQALEEFKAFLYAHAEHPDVPLVPQSTWSDDLWHEFIAADTRAYARFCDAVFGEFLHHDGVNASPEELAAYREQTAAILAPSSALAQRAVECHIALAPRAVECHIALAPRAPAVALEERA